MGEDALAAPLALGIVGITGQQQGRTDGGRDADAATGAPRMGAARGAGAGPMADRLLSAPEVAERLQLTTDFIYALARKDEIPHLRFGRTLRFRAAAIETWLQEQEQTTNRRNHRCKKYRKP
jgi:excisionase family DNA binding protein